MKSPHYTVSLLVICAGFACGGLLGNLLKPYVPELRTIRTAIPNTVLSSADPTLLRLRGTVLSVRVEENSMTLEVKGEHFTIAVDPNETRIMRHVFLDDGNGVSTGRTSAELSLEDIAVGSQVAVQYRIESSSTLSAASITPIET